MPPPFRHPAPEPSRRRSPLYGTPGRIGLAAGMLLAGGYLLSRSLGRGRAGRGRAGQGRAGREGRSARLCARGAALLAASTAIDSAMGHYRGQFSNPAMYVAPTVSGLMLLAGIGLAAGWSGPLVDAVSMAGIATGVAGTGFHLYNITKRPGGFSFQNLFYAAPVGAPSAVALAGGLALCATRLDRAGPRPGRASLAGIPVRTLLPLAVAGGILGTVGEVALLHFRGAYQNAYMVLPLGLPPLTAAMLPLAIRLRSGTMRRLAETLLGATALVGGAGVLFHAYGIHRNMGGWGNWSQMLLQGPPVAAPPAFTGLALAGFAALQLEDRS